MNVDIRPMRIERRAVREGDALHFESRCSRVNPDGSAEVGGWVRTVTVPNYGACFGKKSSILGHVASFLRGIVNGCS